MNIVENEYNVKTTVISSEDSSNTYEIIRAFDEFVTGGKMLIVTLYPTIDTTNAHSIDSSWLHLQNHLPDLGVGTVRIVNLFSTVWKGKPSSSSLIYDEDNLSYIDEVLKEGDFDNVVIAWGTSLLKHKVANRAKLHILEKLRELEIEVYQLSAGDLVFTDTNATHPLFLGLRTKEKWLLMDYSVEAAITQLNIALADKPKKKPARKRKTKKKEAVDTEIKVEMIEDLLAGEGED